MNILIPLGLFLLLRKSGKRQKWESPLIHTSVTSRYGNRINPVTKEKEFHNGVDLVAPENSPVHAPLDATLTKVLTNDKGGLQAVLTHPNGYKSGYVHLNRVLFSEGSKLKRGEFFALSGNTGTLSTGAHLHFTVMDDNGKRVNPETLISFS